jgi:hypothetical protein
LPPKNSQFSPKEGGGDRGAGGSARGDGGRPCALAKRRPVGHEIREAGRRRSNMVAKVPDLGHLPPVDALCGFYFCKNKYKTSSYSSSGPVGCWVPRLPRNGIPVSPKFRVEVQIPQRSD